MADVLPDGTPHTGTSAATDKCDRATAFRREESARRARGAQPRVAETENSLEP
jgi:hypothetical protein